MASDIETLTSHLYHLRRDKERLDEQVNEIKVKLQQHEGDYRQLSTQITTSHTELRKRLIDFKPFVDLLNGVIPEVITQKKETTISKCPVRREENPGSIKELISEIVAKLKLYNREYNFEDVANYVVSIHQNFLTVFAGLPGIGKTSLVTYLAKALGLVDQERLLFIPTARGWTSQRDILGFYNPLNQNFQPSPTGLYEALKNCEQESEANCLFPYWVLLDEANLSPIEHYWSSFLAMCDDHSRKIINTGDIGGRGELTIPKSLRFIATVNHDSTTEPLSSRMIDRVPIILISHTEGQEYFDETSNDDLTGSNNQLLAYEDLINLFQPLQSTDGLNDDERRILSEIIKSLQYGAHSTSGIPIIVSPRKQRFISNYCSLARDLMKDRYSLRALDFAIAQHILPLINGSGEKYRGRLNALLKSIDQLDYSKNILTHIIEAGENEHHFYNFFY